MAHFKSITGPLLDPLQFAYRANCSVKNAANLSLHFILQNLDTHNSRVRILFVDFSSAFNNIIPELHSKVIQLASGSPHSKREMRADFQRYPPDCLSLEINGQAASVCELFKFPGTTITNTLRWDMQVTSIFKNGLQENSALFTPAQELNFSWHIMVNFYSAIIESAVISSITICFFATYSSSKTRLQWVLRRSSAVSYYH